MMVGQIPFEKFTALLSNSGLRVSIGPFNVRINTASTTLASQIHDLYKDYKLAENEIAEFHVRIVEERPKKKYFLHMFVFLLTGNRLFRFSQ